MDYHSEHTDRVGNVNERPSNLHAEADLAKSTTASRPGKQDTLELSRLGFPDANELLTESSQPGYGAAAGAVIDGAVNKIKEHPLEVAGSALAGVATGIAAAALAPEVAIAAGIAGAAYGAYALYEHAASWWDAADKVAHGDEHTEAEVASGKKTLNDLGGDALLLAAAGAGGSASASIRRAGTAGYGYLRGLVSSSEDAAITSSEGSLAGKSAGGAYEQPPKASDVVTPNRGRLLGEGDEGKVYDAGKFRTGDGRSVDSVWKVYDTNALGNSTYSVIKLNQELRQMGIRVPEILETGKTADGHFAVRFEKIGADGETLKDDLRVGALSLAERKEAQRQYDQVIDKLAANHVYGDIQLKNFIWDRDAHQLVWVDPGLLKSGDVRPLGQRYSDAIAPR